MRGAKAAVWGVAALAAVLALAAPAQPAAPATDVLGLAELTALALSRHPAVQQAAANREAARARLVQQRSYFWPQADAEASWRKSRNERSTIGEPGDRQVLAGLNLSQALFDYPLWGRSEAASWEADAYDQQYLAVVNAVRAEVRFAYLDLLAARRLLEVAVAKEEDTRAFRDRTERLLAQGLAARPELARADLDLAEARRAVIEARTGLRRLAARLAQAAGAPQVYDLAVGGEVTVEPAAARLAEPDLEELGLARRPELRQLDYLGRAAAAAVEAARGGHLPTLDLRADFGQTGKDGLADEYHDYGLFLDLPLFTGWRITGALNERRALKRAADQAWEQKRQEVRREVRQGWQGLVEARAKVEVGDAQQKAAEENWRLVKGRYDNGLATPLELSEARTQLYNARAEVERARYGVQSALAELDRAVGGAIMPFGPEPDQDAAPAGSGGR
ncbi:MAG: TolC family protein [Thermodesulfobacteriota bacterium]